MNRGCIFELIGFFIRVRVSMTDESFEHVRKINRPEEAQKQERLSVKRLTRDRRFLTVFHRRRLTERRHNSQAHAVFPSVRRAATVQDPRSVTAVVTRKPYNRGGDRRIN